MLATILAICIAGSALLFEAEQPDPPFEVSSSFSVEGTDDFPIYALNRYSTALRVVPSDDALLIVNPQANRLALRSIDSDELRYYGREGSGPGEFLDSIDAARLEDSWFVLERGNPRIQRIDDAGSVVETFSYTAGSALTHLIQRNESSLWLGGWQSCSGEGICLLSVLSLDDNVPIQSAAPVRDQPLNIAWRFAVDETNRVYAINANGTVVDVFDERGSRVEQIDISSESIRSLPESILGLQDQRQRLTRGVEAMRNEPHTFVAAIAASDTRLYVQHGLANFGTDSEYVVDIFSHDGRLLAQGLQAPGRLQEAHDNELIFVNYQDVDPFGVAEIIVGRWKI